MTKDQVRSTEEALSLEQTLRLALEALEEYCEHGAIFMPITVRDAIKATLEAKDEPVQTVPNFDQLQQIVNNLERCLTRDSKHEFLRVWIRDWTEHKLSKTTPPQRPSRSDIKPLTDDEINALDYSGTRIEFVRAIEAKLKEKNI